MLTLAWRAWWRWRFRFDRRAGERAPLTPDRCARAYAGRGHLDTPAGQYYAAVWRRMTDAQRRAAELAARRNRQP